MGEPLDNLEECCGRSPSFASLLVRVPERRITVSTVGMSREWKSCTRHQGQIAVSLHAIDPARRLALLPVAPQVSLAELRAALERPRAPCCCMTLIDGVNDALQTPTRWPGSAKVSMSA